MKRFTVIVVLALTLIFECRGQKNKILSDDLVKINSHYDNIAVMAMQMDYHVYSSWSSLVPIQTENGELKKKGTSTYTKIGAIESLNTLYYNVIVDNEIKSIAIMPVLRSGESAGNIGSVTPDLSKILDKCKSVELDEIGSEQKKYTLTMPEGGFEYSKLEITYNSKSYLIDMLVMFYRVAQNLEGDDDGIKETPRIEITYHNYKTKLDFTPATFTYERFLNKKGNEYFCKKQYSSYELINQMN